MQTKAEIEKAKIAEKAEEANVKENLKKFIENQKKAKSPKPARNGTSGKKEKGKGKAPRECGGLQGRMKFTFHHILNQI